MLRDQSLRSWGQTKTSRSEERKSLIGTRVAISIPQTPTIDVYLYGDGNKPAMSIESNNFTSVEELRSHIMDKLGLSSLPDLEYFQDITREYLPLSTLSDLPTNAIVRIFKELNISELVGRLKEHLKLKDKRRRFKNYPNCFFGSDAVDWIVNGGVSGCTSRQSAVEIMNRAVDQKLVIPLARPNKGQFEDKLVYYRTPILDPETEEHEHSTTNSVYSWKVGQPGPSLLDFKFPICQIACGTTHSLALCANTGKVYSWGEGASGQLGLGPDITTVKQPTVISSIEQPVALIVAGCAQSGCTTQVDKDSTNGIQALYTWGCLANTVEFTPKQVVIDIFTERSKILDVSFGLNHAMLLVEDTMLSLSTSVLTWGLNNKGQLGVGMQSPSSSNPTAVLYLENKNIVAISAGDSHSMALSKQSEVYVWGCNCSGELGIGSTDNSILPFCLNNLPSVQRISCGGKNSLVVSTSGHVYSWGSSANGHLGGNVPTLMDDLFDITKVFCGRSYSVACQQNSGMFVWGKLRNSVTCTPVPMILPDQLILQISCNTHSILMLVFDDNFSLVSRATIRKFGTIPSEYQKLVSLFSSGVGQSLQVLARRRLQSSSKKISKHASSLKCGSRSAMFSKKERTSFSRMLSVSFSKFYLNFGQEGENCPIYKFLNDQIQITNEGSTDLSFSFCRLPLKITGYAITYDPPSGIIPPDSTVTVDIQLAFLEAGTWEFLIFLDVLSAVPNNDMDPLRHMIFVSMKAENHADCPEIPFHLIEHGKKIATGASGKVTKVNLQGIDAAVKQFFITGLNREDFDVFRTEVLIASHLDHPNIVKCIGVCTEYPHLCLVMEFFPIGDLRSLLRNSNNTLSLSLLLKFAYDISQGIRYLHSKKIIHRDLKSDNVMIGSLELKRGVANAKVIDFGASVLRSDKLLSDVGTARYIPPEVISKSQNSNEKIDVYSFGIVLWEIFSMGDLPYKDITFTGQLLENVVQGIRPQIPQDWKAPKGIVSLMTRCWAASPEERPTISEIETILYLHLVARKVPVEIRPDVECEFPDSRVANYETVEQLSDAKAENQKKIDEIESTQSELRKKISELEKSLEENDILLKKHKLFQLTLDSKISLLS